MDRSSDTISHAIVLIRQGKKEEARQILRAQLKANPLDETAWLWLAETAENDRQRIWVLEQCLKLIPNSLVAQQGITRLRAIQAASAAGLSQPSAIRPAAATPERNQLPPSAHQETPTGLSEEAIPVSPDVLAPATSLALARQFNLPRPSSEIPTKPTPKRATISLPEQPQEALKGQAGPTTFSRIFR